MLAHLNISNLAIISHLEVEFKPGLNILSGETGTGKSIIINAVHLILGGRASADFIRSGAQEAVVEALFELPENTDVSDLLADHDLPFQGELLVKRSISREGRNKIRINGSIATLQTLSKVGLLLISIAGQHEHQRLLKPDQHLYLLDDFGGLSGDRLHLNETYRDYQALIERRRVVAREVKQRGEKRELTHFQMEEIERANIKTDEDLLLDNERKRLRHAEQLTGIMTESYQRLYEVEDSVLSNLSACLKLIDKGISFDERLANIAKTMSSARVDIEEAALDLREIQQNIVIDPGRLEEVEERIMSLKGLKRKYGPTLPDVTQFYEKLLGMVDDLDQKDGELKEIENGLGEMERNILSQASSLSGKRKDAAQKMQKAIKKELNRLDMAGTRFQIRFIQDVRTPRGDLEEEPPPISADGFDNVEFMLSPNVGEELRPLAKTASGGELSRIMLGLKTILARTASVETIIFDEVDAGIGGATAEVVGEKLKSLAKYHQIICITHLPQIASKGTTHFLVEKKVAEGRTLTSITALDQPARVREIARLLGGKVISDRAMAHASEMLS
ncbi:DNA repair protein RecN [Thermodesulfobacteriota bacterium]